MSPNGLFLPIRYSVYCWETLLAWPSSCCCCCSSASCWCCCCCLLGLRICARSRSRSRPGRKDSRRASTLSSLGPHLWKPASFCSQMIIVLFTERMLTSDLSRQNWSQLVTKKEARTLASSAGIRVCSRAPEQARPPAFASSETPPVSIEAPVPVLATRARRQWKIGTPNGSTIN